MVDAADLLDFIQWDCIVEIDHMRTNCIEVSVFYLHALWRYIHPGSTLASEIHDVETFKSVIL